jgi:1,4-dihydroxy-2-naphthoate octaprenyltransferase
MERMLRKNKVNKKIYDSKVIVAISVVFMFVGTIMGVLSGHLILRLIVIAIMAGILYLNRNRFTQIITLVKNKRK